MQRQVRPRRAQAQPQVRRARARQRRARLRGRARPEEGLLARLPRAGRRVERVERVVYLLAGLPAVPQEGVQRARAQERRALLPGQGHCEAELHRRLGRDL